MVGATHYQNSKSTIKFLCSYNGKITLRYTDGKLRYVGGLIRLLAVDRSISYAELMVKLGEFCGYSVNLKCQLPNGDLETLISIKSDEELACIIEEYERAFSQSPFPLQIKAVLSPPKSLKQISPSSSATHSNTSSVDFSADKQQAYVPADRLYARRSCYPEVSFPVDARQLQYFPCYVKQEPRFWYRVPDCNH